MSLITVSLTVQELTTLPTTAYTFWDAIWDATGTDDNGTAKTVAGTNNTSPSLNQSNTLYLWEAGCRVDGTDNWDCYTFCYDTVTGPTRLWSSENSTRTLQNCMVYPFLVAALEDGLLHEDTAHIVTKYGIRSEPLPVRLDSTAWPVINHCLAAYCKAVGSNAKSCNEHPWYTDYTFGTYSDTQMDRQELLSPNMTLLGSGSLCWPLSTSLNSDIGGPGVVISYIILVVLTQSSCLCFAFAKGWAGALLYVKLMVTEKGKTIARERTNKFVARLTKHKLTAALVSALFELQKTQVFFMLTLEIASLIALYDPTKSQAYSSSQLSSNLVFLERLPLTASSTTVLILLMLRKDKPLAWFILSWSTACVILSTALSLTVVGFQPRADQFYMLPYWWRSQESSWRVVHQQQGTGSIHSLHLKAIYAADSPAQYSSAYAKERRNSQYSASNAI
ncbi:hypothetical protein LTR17_014634 [Elasticomyces elasticus]|nr:hypothetical protein LTR17_014634 [Elasticomyces elasticus]